MLFLIKIDNDKMFDFFLIDNDEFDIDNKIIFNDKLIFFDVNE